MFKSMKLGAKIASGFGIVILITVLLGALTVWNMTEVSQETTVLTQEFVPQVASIVELQEHVREMMYHARGYGYTADPQFLVAARKSVEEIRKNLTEARRLAESSPHLSQFKGGLDTLEARLTEYFKLVDQTQEKVEGLARNRKLLDEASAQFMKSAYVYLEGQNRETAAEIQAGAEPARLMERLDKITWINDVIDLGNLITNANFKAQLLRDSKIAQEALVHFPKIDEKISTILTRTTQDADKKTLADIQQAARSYQAASTDPSGNWQGLLDVNNKRREVGDAALAMTGQVTQKALEHITQTSDQSLRSLVFASRVTKAGLALAVLLGATLAFFLTRSITRVVHRIVASLNNGAEQVASASGQVSSSSQQMAEGASEQAAAIEETSSSLEEMSSMTRQNAENATQADALVKETARVMTRANRSMDDLTVSMADISNASEETSKIIKTIDEIAFQTNLLALNAAVEAARAGEAGAGFAVVADEVRNLAMRAAEAARNTATLIEGTVKKVKDGSALVGTTNDAFQQAAANAEKVAGLVGEIAAASSEQAQGIEQLNRAMTEMDKVVQQNAASAEENASASEELSAQARHVSHAVAELASLVGGSGKRSAHEGRADPGSRDGQEKKTKAAARGMVMSTSQALLPSSMTGGNGSAANGASRGVRPERAFPLDDQDLKEF
ncbi:MAG: methyl-accepting chemotaxis protein [Syntrophobacteraceae bacterium]|jgi:methyl-accepting chemotaxis protein|nr:methyl-accepting chemotaxis protein [Syntrophobacteraceae bacterium]